MLCREQVAQLRDALPGIRARGAGLIVVGNGTPAMAAAFQREWAPDLAVFTDPGREAYRALGLGHGLTTFSWSTLVSARRAWRGGFRQGRTQGDPWQQGGVFVLGPGATTRYAYVSRVSGDHPDVAEVLAAVAPTL
jgi:hypothetical protein